MDKWNLALCLSSSLASLTNFFGRNDGRNLQDFTLGKYLRKQLDKVCVHIDSKCRVLPYGFIFKLWFQLCPKFYRFSHSSQSPYDQKEHYKVSETGILKFLTDEECEHLKTLG